MQSNTPKQLKNRHLKYLFLRLLVRFIAYRISLTLARKDGICRFLGCTQLKSTKLPLSELGCRG